MTALDTEIMVKEIADRGHHVLIVPVYAVASGVSLPTGAFHCMVKQNFTEPTTTYTHTSLHGAVSLAYNRFVPSASEPSKPKIKIKRGS